MKLRHINARISQSTKHIAHLTCGHDDLSIYEGTVIATGECDPASKAHLLASRHSPYRTDHSHRHLVHAVDTLPVSRQDGVKNRRAEIALQGNAISRELIGGRRVCAPDCFDCFAKLLQF